MPELLDADLAACRASLAANSKTFHAASLLLPPAVRAPATVLYGFCRLADDTVDVEGGRRLALSQLRRRLDRVFEGRPQPVAADRALAAVVARHGIPRALLDLLMEGLAWDVDGRSYDTLDDLQDYAARVAGTVGAMMSLLMGVRDAPALARACDLGVAMQLSNIARDVGEDAAMGRLYLPRQWLREAGLDPAAWLAAPAFSPALAGVVQRLLDAADMLYARAAAGVACLPLACRPGINAARLMYAAVGHEVARAGCDSMSRRAVVPRRRKQRLLLRAAVSLWPGQALLLAPPLPASRPLLAAVAATPAPGPGRKIDFVIDLFDRLGRQDREAGLGRGVA
jgi:phytoene synthase